MELLLTRDSSDDRRVFAELQGYKRASSFQKIVYSLKQGENIESTIEETDVRFPAIFSCNNSSTYSVVAELYLSVGESITINSNSVDLSVSIPKIGVPKTESQSQESESDEPALMSAEPEPGNTIEIVDTDKQHALFVKFKPNGKEALEKRGESRCLFRSIFSEADKRRIESHPMKDNDVLNIYEVVMHGDGCNEELLAVALDLNALDEVEYVSLETTEISPPVHQELLEAAPAQNQTPDFTSKQTYMNPLPGMDVKYAWGKGITGQGSVVRHLDFGLIQNHEDLQGITVVSATGSNPDHGSASLGCIKATKNGFGVTGIAYGGTTYVYNTGQLSKILADAHSGDIVSLDIQYKGCNTWYPFDFSLSNWNLIKNAADSGVIVILAAGNGGNNLDTFSCGSATYHGDHGGMQVGAGSSSSLNRLSFSNYGKQVTINSWGQNVTTTGYGDLHGQSKGPQSYTSTYGGTSSATPLCAGALALIQSYSKTVYKVTLNGKTMRSLLQSTGNISAGQNIGVRPDVKNAMMKLDEMYGNIPII